MAPTVFYQIRGTFKLECGGCTLDGAEGRLSCPLGCLSAPLDDLTTDPVYHNAARSVWQRGTRKVELGRWRSGRKRELCRVELACAAAIQRPELLRAL